MKLLFPSGILKRFSESTTSNCFSEKRTKDKIESATEQITAFKKFFLRTYNIVKNRIRRYDPKM